MPGPWQHNIPQSLLRGFRTPGRTKKTSQVWLFEKGHEPILAVVKSVAAADDFYSCPSVDGSKTLDEEITSYEQTSFTRALRYLKESEPNSTVDSANAAEVVTHLTIRNDHLRRTFSEASQKLVSGAIDVLCDETLVRSLLGIDAKAPSDRITKAIDDFLADHPEFGNISIPRHVLYRMIHMMARESFNSSFLEGAPQIAAALTSLVVQAPAFVREGHNKALASGLAPRPRSELLCQFSWTVRMAGTEGLILPDCVALGSEAEHNLRPLMLTNLTESTLVLMPLSSRKMLVGTRNNRNAPDLADFNRAASACSHQYFVAAGNHFSNLVKNVGAASNHFMEETVEAILSEYKKGSAAEKSFAPTASTKPDLASNEEVATSEAASPSAPQCSIHFRDCANKETAERIGANIFFVISEMSRIMPLDRLDGMTFAYDCQAALRELDRGLASTELEIINEEFETSIAMASIVIRDGVRKTHIVMRGELGHYLLGDDEANCRLALQLIVGQLAHVASSQMLEETLPEAKISDQFEAFLYQYADSAWRDYFGARVSASFNSRIGNGYCEMLAAAIQRARRDVVAAKLEYQSLKDMDKLMQVALPRVHDILRCSATVLGHFDGLGGPLLQNQSQLETALANAGLRNWLLLFDGELSELWNRKGNWASFDEFLVLNEHVERILWQHGLIPWRTDDGRIWVDVRFATTSEQLEVVT